MGKLKVRKDVVEQIKSKLKPSENGLETSKKDIFLSNFAENKQNQQVTSKLQATIGQTADGQIYDLTDPTEKFYYDLKRKFDEAERNTEIEKGMELRYVVPKSGKRKPYYQHFKCRDKLEYNPVLASHNYTKEINEIFTEKNNNKLALLKQNYQNKMNIAKKSEDKKRYSAFVKIIDKKININNGKLDNITSYAIKDSGKIKTEFNNMIETEKRKLSTFEKKMIEKDIKNGSWVDVKTTKGNTIHLDFTKYFDTINDHPNKLKWELENASILADLGFSVYLVPELRDGSVDVIINNLRFELKHFSGSSHRADKIAHEIYTTNPNGAIFIAKEAKLSDENARTIFDDNFSKTKNKKGILLTYSERNNDVTLKNYSDIKKGLLKSNPIQHGFGLDLSLADYIVACYTDLSSKKVIKSLTYSGHKLQGRTRLYGMDISIENKKGSYRSGVDKDGHKWKTLMHYDYGYIRGTVGTDKDHLDCYVGPDKETQKVYVIHQNDPVTHKYDEDKCMLCFSNAADAKAAYMKQYDRPGFYGSMTTMTIEQFKSFIFSHKGKMVHKSFDINITDITENNKQQKLEQVNKALNAIADNRPFMIKHIPADSSTNYGNLLVRITDFDRSKIEKAVHKIALSLDADISGASKGETFVYKAQEELVDKYFKEFTNRTRAIYNFVIGYFDLPDIRIVSKAGELRHKGKILYNPSTGLPIKESDWKKFVVELEKFLNRNYTGIGEKIVLSAESLGIILDRLSKTNSLDAIRKMSVADLKAKRYDVDWIGDSIRNMKDKFGDVISRERQARIQIAMDSAAQRVTRVKDDMRNNIQQIIIDGIRDKQSKSVVAQNLFDKCASLNRDMQRIADSEVQMAANSAYIQEEVYNSEPGSKVYFKRFEMMDDNTCKKCKKLNGTIVLWSDVPLPDERIKDPFAKYAIWDGKNDGDCPVGIVHPWCRGSWIRYYPEV